MLILLVAALGLPINDLFRYALLLLATVPVFACLPSRRTGAWLAAIAVVAAAVVARMLLPVPQIEEGHNVYIIDGSNGGALQRELPADAYRQMAAEFDARYPPERRCDPRAAGCWRAGGFPSRAYAFSTDAIYRRAAYSRQVTGIGFDDPVWQRLGFVNDARYNWYGASDVQRGSREPFWNLLHPWRLKMPHFVMYRFPGDFVGSRLCWRGLVLWEGANEAFTPWRHADMACRPIEPGDAGRRIFGTAISAPLSMSLDTPLSLQLRRLIAPALALSAVAAVLLLLLRWEPRKLALPFILIGFALLVVFLSDASFIGGLRPFDGGDDGLVYESLGRNIVENVLRGEFARALEGGESVFYYGGPGLRYFRAAEHFIFGDTFLGYLSLTLLLPLAAFAAFHRFFGARAALALALIFVAVPIGTLFGSSFWQYAKWAARGFADPAAATMFLGGFVVLIGAAAAGPGGRFAPAFGAGLLFALALWVRPNLAPSAGVLLGGAGIAALWQRQPARVAGLFLGFLPVLGMALHNWAFGGVFVLFSANATIPEAIPMPPSAYVAAFGELLRLDFAGEHVRRGVLQVARWLSGTSESFLMVPLHAAAIAVLVRVMLSGRHDPWLRLAAGAMLAQHPVALFYLSGARYSFLAWFMTMLVCAVWVRDEGLDLFGRACPRTVERLARHPARARLAEALDWWMRASRLAAAPARK